MPRGPCTFRQRDLTAAVRAATNAGCEVARIEVGKDGKIVLVTGSPGASNKEVGAAGSEWDDLLS
jgi:hypothetical protein